MPNGLLDGILGYWKLEEEPDHPDETGNGNTIEILNGTAFPTTAGIDGTAANQGLDTINRRGIAAPSAFHFGNDSFSGNVWINGSAADWVSGTSKALMGVYDDDASADERSWLVQYLASTDTFRFFISDDGITNTIVEAGQGTPVADTWHQLSFGYDKAAGEIWIQYNDDTRVTAAHTTGAFAASTAPFTFGWAANSAEFRMGDIKYDELAIWGRAISTADVTELNNSGSGIFFDEFEVSTSDLSGVSPLEIRRLIPAATSIPMIPKSQAGGVLHGTQMQSYSTALEMQASDPCVANVFYRLVKEADDR